ncbi:peptidoglycan DD-metalloendopeptidase family protein [Patescibacteria group bacterium]
MYAKRFLAAALLKSGRPLRFVWRNLAHPTLVFGYRSGRAARKWLARKTEPWRNQLKSRYALHAVVALIALSVSATNLQAREMPVTPQDVGRHSILSRVTGHELEDLVVEEGVPVEFAKEITYLGTHTVSAQEHYALSSLYGDGNPENDILVEDDLPSVPIVNALRPQSDLSGDTGVRTRTRIIVHVVEEGENAGSIARRYGLQTNSVLQPNNLTARSVLRPGQQLDILPVDGILYTVRSGDTLVKISSKYKTDATKIMEFNGMSDASHLTVGEDIMLPDGKIPPPPAPTRQRLASVSQVFKPASDSGTTRLLWPTSARRITQYYNYRHRGVDIAGPVGTPIYASDDGVVTFSGWNSGGYGRMVIVDHQNGLFTRYAHASRNLVSKGDVVRRGDVIQLMGSTGRSTGPHIHYEVLSGSIYNRVNPFDYIR